jgi:hypothetical protein
VVVQLVRLQSFHKIRQVPARIVVFGLAIAIATCCSSACAPSGPASAPPKIVFQETTYDFGRAAQGTKVTHTYAFRNGGNLDLSIDNVRASCDCTVAALSARVIPPGGDGTIEATFDTAHDIGRKTRTITVYSNDPAHPVTTLSLIGSIDADVAADPPALYVGHLRRGQAAPNEVRLSAADGTALSTADAHTKVIDASLHSVAGGTRLQVTIKPDAPAGRFKETVTLRTKSARQPVVTIPVVGVVDADAPSARAAE